MAEVAAIALAGNILQFLELGIKLTKTARRAYKSSDGFIKEDTDFIADTQRLQSLVGLIDKTRSPPDGTRQALIDDNLLAAAKTCDKYASDLMALLEFMRIRPGVNRSWESIRVTVVRMAKDSEIQTLNAKMISARTTLILSLTTSSYLEQSSVLATVRQLKHQNAVLEANTTAKLESIESLIRKIDPKEAKEAKVATEMIAYLKDLDREARQVKRHQDLLKSLRFSILKQRHNAIMERHKATFEWVFKKNTTSYCEWLESGCGFFWVKGKAGSGKSTLMKYLASHHETESRLRIWGSRQKVVIASHFFWNSGTTMQKSLTGLFQTILFQVIKMCPELIDVVGNCRNEPSDLSFAEPWHDEELRLAFQSLSTQKSLPLRFCFFIDGLDEYTAGGQRYTGTFEELLEPLRILASSDSIKICVSSRPWHIFDIEFSKLDWQMQLEDLTRDDIRSYVKQELGADPKFQELSKKDPRCSQIPDTIVQRAQGVFLWVFLVVNSLRRGLGNEDNYSDLQERLNELPDDLQEYFEHMLLTIDNVYWDSTTQIFRTVIAAEQSLPLLSFHFLDQEIDEPGYAATMQLYHLSNEECESIHRRSKARLNARCRDLLYVAEHNEATGIFRYQVDFLHRTVRDFFLDTRVMDEIIQQRPTQKFNPYLSLCKIMLALSKMKATDTTSEMYNHVFILADSLMFYARKIEESYTQFDQDPTVQTSLDGLSEVFALLDELDRTNSQRLGTTPAHWTNRKDPPKGLFQEWQKKTFLASAIQARLSLYVQDRLRKQPSELRQKGGRPLLDYALRPMMITPLTITELEQGPVIPILKVLLNLGAEPNAGIYIYDRRTPWELFLEKCCQHKNDLMGSGHISEDLVTAMELMIAHGARVNGTYRVSKDSSMEFKSIVDEVGLLPHQVSKIQEIIEQRGESKSFLSGVLSWVYWS